MQIIILFGFLSILFSGITACSPAPITLPPEPFRLPSPPAPLPELTTPDERRVFETDLQTDTAYRIGIGDELTLEIWDNPSLSGKHIVGPDGKITLPLIGTFMIADLTREEAAQQIKTSLEKYYASLNATIRVDRYATNRILILGQVNKPGEIPFDLQPPTLLEAIAKAGGLVNVAGLDAAASLTMTRCAIFRGRDKIVWIELAPLLTGRDLSLNLKLQRRDVVYIPAVAESLIYVLGEVQRPGALTLTPNMSFLEVLAKVGGPTIDAAPSRINLIRPSQNATETFDLNDFLNPNNKINVALQAGDILYIPTNTVAKINYAMKILTPFTSLLDIYSDIESIRADTQRRRLDAEKERLEREQLELEKQREALQQTP